MWTKATDRAEVMKNMKKVPPTVIAPEIERKDIQISPLLTLLATAPRPDA